MIDIGAWGKDWFLTTLAAPARRGDRVLRVHVPSRVVPGTMILLRLTDTPERSLWHHAHNGQGDYPVIGGRMPMNEVNWLVRVDDVDVASKTITLHQPLRSGRA